LTLQVISQKDTLHGNKIQPAMMNAFNVQITIQYRLNMYRFGSLM